MADNVEPEVLVNSILGKVTDVLINGDGDVIPKSDDHFLAFMSPGVPVLEDDFNYALEGFGGVYRRNADAESEVADRSTLRRVSPKRSSFSSVGESTC